MLHMFSSKGMRALFGVALDQMHSEFDDLEKRRRVHFSSNFLYALGGIVIGNDFTRLHLVQRV